MGKLIAVGAALALTGCATWGPTWSEITGQRFNRPSPAGLNVSPTTISMIDGNGAFPNRPGQPIKVAPGERRVDMRAVPLSAGWAAGTDLVTMQLDAQPCKRYYINAKFENPLGPSWTPFIDFVEDIAGCQVEAAK